MYKIFRSLGMFKILRSLFEEDLQNQNSIIYLNLFSNFLLLLTKSNEPRKNSTVNDGYFLNYNYNNDRFVINEGVHLNTPFNYKLYNIYN